MRRWILVSDHQCETHDLQPDRLPDDGEVPSAWGIYVQTKSKVKLTINGAAGSYGSTIKSYSITGGGYSGSASGTLTTGFLNNSGTITFKATVTDSRGRVSAGVISITVTAYSPPYFNSSCPSGA